jgi:hypothetical protein
MHRIVAVTPAGRRKYLELLKHYVLRDSTIAEWHLWDNCRKSEDRTYIQGLAREHPKVKIVEIQGADGSNRSVNRFYPFCKDVDAFYIKMDDDLVYLPDHIGERLYRQAIAERDKYIWWSPLIVNNAICSWLLKYHSRVEIPEFVSCQAADSLAWANPGFAERLHRKFLAAVETNDIGMFQVPDFEVSLSRFSINCIGFFGKDVAELGEGFCPVGVDDEEWISAVLPSQVGKPGRIAGAIATAHFSYYTQEADLLKCRILDDYYRIAGLKPEPYQIQIMKRSLKQRVFSRLRAAKNRILGS